jgi:hypothetical protein
MCHVFQDHQLECFTINFTQAMPNANYAGVCNTGNVGAPRNAAIARSSSTAQYARLETDNASNVPANFSENSVIIVG